MRRREFITLLGGAVAWPLTAGAADKIPKVGVLWHAANEEEEAEFLSAVRDGFRNLGYIEGKNILLINRFANEQYDRFNSLATELAALNVDVIFAVTEPAALAAQRATKDIPIVFVVVPDPVAVKLVNSLARPGSNLTGVATLGTSLVAKRYEFFKQAVPNLSRVALLVNTGDQETVRRVVEGSKTASSHLGLSVEPITARTPAEIDAAFETAARNKVDGVFLTPDAMYYNERKRISNQGIMHHLPTMCVHGLFVEAGGLISYGPNFPTLFRRATDYVHRILGGAKPHDMPVEQPTKFELAINLKTAKALGLEISPMLLTHADVVIE
jgi:putative ABC transport system substrate-binding protein